ncbi:Outer membrane protein (porin) [Burkholderia singularis]|uniref:Outer membrane protein (Porin) n=1 Tax=Burkholderia singularis TaxID=1503053 RepID=A0A238GZ69_9BURK|nr:Outer membrane protein (porin) [Burkholderia singularis]
MTELSIIKTSLFAAAISGTLVASAHAQSSVTLYGLIDTGIVYTNNQNGHSSWRMGTSSTQNTVFGLKGAEDLGGGLHAVFKLEQGFNLNNGSQAFSGDAFGSQAWAGLQSEPYGTVTFGRQFDVLNDLLGPLSAGSNTWGGNLAAHPFGNDNLAANSVTANNTVKYVSPTRYGVTAAGMYSFSNQAGGFANNRAYGISAAFAQGPVNVAAGYLQFNNAGGGPAGGNPNGALAQSDSSANFIAKRQRIWGAGGSYALGPATVGLVWSHTQIDDMINVMSLGSGSYMPLHGTLRIDNYEVNAKYAITPAWVVSAAYTLTDGAYSNGATNASPKWNTVMLQTAYSLSKRTDVYVEGVYQHVHGAPSGSALANAMINTLSPSSTGTQVAVTAGLRHAF